MRTILIRLALAAGVVTGIAAASAGIPSHIARRDAAFIPDPQVAKIAAIGFDSVIADLHWVRAVQLIGSERDHIGHGATIGALIDVVTTLDPWVDHPYRFAAVWMNEDEATVRKANELIRRGIKHHPDDWRGYFYLAFNHFFYLDEQREAARALKPALGMPDAPRYLKLLSARLESRAGGLEASAAFLAEMARQAASENERASFEAALEEIETERRARFLDAARAEYVRRHKRDIASVDDLVAGGVLRRLPADPYGEGWGISPLTGEIVSKRLRFRYDVKIDGTSRRQLAAFRERSLEEQDK